MELKLPNGYDGNSLNAPGAFIDSVKALEEPLAALMAKLSAAQPVSCVISDFYHPSSFLAALKAGLPSVCFWPGMATWASIQYNHSSLVSAGYVPVDESNGKKIVQGLPGLKPMRAQELPFYLHEDFYKTVGHERFTWLMDRIEKESWVLVDSIYELEPEVFDAMQQSMRAKFVSVGPLFPLKGHGNASELQVSLRPEAREALLWLDLQPPKSVIYVAFGSVTVLSPANFEELAAGLEASKHRFLLVAPSELVDQAFVDEFVERVARSETGMVVRWAPQLAVLQHESVGGFLTHCGWNSIMESLSSGVPMLGWPQASEQNLNCKLVLEERGFGMELRDTSRGGVARAIQNLMANQEIRSRAVEIEECVRRAATRGGSSYKNLEEFFKMIPVAVKKSEVLVEA